MVNADNPTQAGVARSLSTVRHEQQVAVLAATGLLPTTLGRVALGAIYVVVRRTFVARGPFGPS